MQAVYNLRVAAGLLSTLMQAETDRTREITLIQASIWDLNAVRDLEHLSFPLDAWPLIEMVGVLTFPSIERWKAMDGETLVGFVAADIRRHQDLAWIATIAVHPDYRRRGIARQMMARVEELVPVSRMRLSARASNRAAIALYQRQGYEQVDVWPKYYSGGEDAVVMEKLLVKAEG